MFYLTMRSFNRNTVLLFMMLCSHVHSMYNMNPCDPCSCECGLSFSRPCIDCSYRWLTSIPAFPLNFTKALKTLIFDWNRIVTVERGTFEHYPNLEYLYLHNNVISNISEDSFRGLVSVKWLRLDNNQIQIVKSNTFRQLERLEYLYLHDNIITYFFKNSFSGLKRLTHLFLEHNRIQTLESNTFRHLEKLEYLKLFDNKICNVSNDSFIGLKRLTTLDLSHSRIQLLKRNTFRQLEKLEKLYLQENEIPSLSKDSFTGLKRLKMLKLNHNRIQILKNNTFQQLENLEELFLIGNEIYNVSKNSFSGLKRLVKLQLDDNRIQIFKIGTFAELTSLETLHLDNNKIKTIGGKSFKPLENLNILHLNGNNLGYIPEALWSLQCPDLQLHLQNNPFQCSCKLLNEAKQLQFKLNILQPTLSVYIKKCASITSACEDERNFALGANVHHNCSTQCPSSTCWQFMGIDLPGVIVVTKVMINMKHLEVHKRNYTITVTVKVGERQTNTYVQCGTFTLAPKTSTLESSCARTPFGSNVLLEISPDHKYMVSRNHCTVAKNSLVSIEKNQVAVYGYERNKSNIWSTWNKWESCSVHCGFGTQKRIRICEKPTSAECLIPASENRRALVQFEEKHCYLKKCSQAVYYWTGSVSAVFLLILSGIIFWYRKYRMVVYFEGLRPNPNFQLDPNRTLMEQIEELPYDLHWEFPRYDVRFGSVLGEGNFGRVWHAKAKGIKAFDPRDRSDLSSRAKLAKLQDQRVHEYFTTITEAWILGDCDTTHHYDVAVKTLKECATPKHKMDLASELKLLIYMDRHPNIVNVLASCTIRGDLWMIMEYCDHGNLKQFLSDRRNRFTPSWWKESVDISAGLCLFDLLQMSEQITKGVMFLHCWKVVHRDLSARNVLIDANYHLKIADFGLARSDNFVAPVDDIMPIKWSSLESLLRHEYSLKSDIWSLGVLLWEIYSLGEIPYPGMKSKEVIQHLKQGYRMGPPSHCPDEIWQVISECWITSPELRPNAMELFQQLNEIKVSVSSAPEGQYYGPGGDYGEAGTIQGPSLNEILKAKETLDSKAGKGIVCIGHKSRVDEINDRESSLVEYEKYHKLEMKILKIQEIFSRNKNVIDTLDIPQKDREEIKLILKQWHLRDRN